jgi:hypothetical protein
MRRPSLSPERTFLAIILLALPFSLGVAAAEDSGVRQLGRTVMQYQDDVVQVVIGYRYASQHLSEPWLLLDTRLNARTGKSVTIHREDVTLLLPGGKEIPLPTQKALGEGFPDIVRVMNAAVPTREPLNGYFVGPRYQEKLRFFTVPGEGVVRDEMAVSYSYLVMGDIFFRSPEAGFAPGEYTLVIKNKDVNVRLPFKLPGEDLKKKDDKAVTW